MLVHTVLSVMSVHGYYGWFMAGKVRLHTGDSGSIWKYSPKEKQKSPVQGIRDWLSCTYYWWDSFRGTGSFSLYRFYLAKDFKWNYSIWVSMGELYKVLSFFIRSDYMALIIITVFIEGVLSFLPAERRQCAVRCGRQNRAILQPAAKLSKSPTAYRKRFKEINTPALAPIQAGDWINYRLCLGCGAFTGHSIKMPPPPSNTSGKAGIYPTQLCDECSIFTFFLVSIKLMLMWEINGASFMALEKLVYIFSLRCSHCI